MKATVAGTTTVYIGDHYEWTGSTSTARRYYYAGAQRVAMRTGTGTVQYLIGDHPSTGSALPSRSGQAWAAPALP